MGGLLRQQAFDDARAVGFDDGGPLGPPVVRCGLADVGDLADARESASQVRARVDIVFLSPSDQRIAGPGG